MDNQRRRRRRHGLARVTESDGSEVLSFEGTDSCVWFKGTPEMKTATLEGPKMQKYTPNYFHLTGVRVDFAREAGKCELCGSSVFDG